MTNPFEKFPGTKIINPNAPTRIRITIDVDLVTQQSKFNTGGVPIPHVFLADLLIQNASAILKQYQEAQLMLVGKQPAGFESNSEEGKAGNDGETESHHNNG